MPKMNMEKDVKKLLEGYEKHTGSDLKVQKTPGAPGMTPSKSGLEEPKDIDNYRSFVVHLMWYTTNLGPVVENTARDLSVHMSHPGPEHWKALGRLIGYLKGKRQKAYSSESLRFLKPLFFVIVIIPWIRIQERVSEV